MAVNVRKLAKHLKYSKESIKEYLELNSVDVNKNENILRSMSY